MTDAAQSQTDVDNMREALKNSKGPGNFRNLFMYAPNGKKDGIQLIPVSEVTAKDEFFNIKNVTRDDLLAAHRVPRTAAAYGNRAEQYRRVWCGRYSGKGVRHERNRTPATAVRADQ